MSFIYRRRRHHQFLRAENKHVNRLIDPMHHALFGFVAFIHLYRLAEITMRLICRCLGSSLDAAQLSIKSIHMGKMTRYHAFMQFFIIMIADSNAAVIETL